MPRPDLQSGWRSLVTKRKRRQPQRRPLVIPPLPDHRAQLADEAQIVLATAGLSRCRECGGALLWGDVAAGVEHARTPDQRAAFFEALSSFAAAEWVAAWCGSCDLVSILQPIDELF